MQTTRIQPGTERRIRREARSAAFAERALALRQAGWTLADIGQALGVCTTRAFQIVRKAERFRLIPSNEEGASREIEARLPDFTNGPPPADRNLHEESNAYNRSDTGASAGN